MQSSHTRLSRVFPQQTRTEQRVRAARDSEPSPRRCFRGEPAGWPWSLPASLLVLLSSARAEQSAEMTLRNQQLVLLPRCT